AKKVVLHSALYDRGIVFERAQGAQYWDTEGREYLDFLSSNMGPAMVGHSHPAVVEAIQKQAAQLVSARITLDTVPVIDLCTKLAAISPLEGTKTYICSGGGEANEAAIKIAMLATGRDG